MPRGEERPESPEAKARPTGGRHARSEDADQHREPDRPEPAGASAPATAPDPAPATEPALVPGHESSDSDSPGDGSPDTEPTVSLPSVSLPAPDGDTWVPFASSEEPASDRDRVTGVVAMVAAAAAVVALCGVGGLLTFSARPDEAAPPAAAATRTSAPPAESPGPAPPRGPSAAPTGGSARATPSARATGTRVATPTRTPATRPAAPARSRAPLTIREVFGSDRITVRGREYRLAYPDDTADCPAGARGTTAAELRRSGCTQLIRALATDGSGRLAVTVGVANLPDAAAARRVVAAGRGGGGFAAIWTRRGHRSGGDGYRETTAAGRFVVYGIAARSEWGRTDRAAMQAVADLSGVIAGRLAART